MKELHKETRSIGIIHDKGMEENCKGMSFENWLLTKFKKRTRCRIVPDLTCRPLRIDHHCYRCYEEETAV